MSLEIGVDDILQTLEKKQEITVFGKSCIPFISHAPHKIDCLKNIKTHLRTWTLHMVLNGNLRSFPEIIRKLKCESVPCYANNDSVLDFRVNNFMKVLLKQGVWVG